VFGFDGLFDKFFNDHLAKQIDTSGATWTWRPGSVNPSQRLLEQFQAARRLRDMFFPAGSKAPSVKFYVTFSDLDSSASRAVLTIDGQNTDDKHAKQEVMWPGPNPGSASSAFEARYFDPPKRYGGPWAWFRMIDATRMAAAPDAGQRILLTLQDHYHRVHVTVEPSTSAPSPFASWDWRQFSCQS
jgi:type VI secretion system protein ImpL